MTDSSSSAAEPDAADRAIAMLEAMERLTDAERARIAMALAQAYSEGKRIAEEAAEAARAARSDNEAAVIEYARNLDAIWHQPHAHNPVGLATHHRELDKGFSTLRPALDRLDGHT